MTLPGRRMQCRECWLLPLNHHSRICKTKQRSETVKNIGVKTSSDTRILIISFQEHFYILVGHYKYYMYFLIIRSENLWSDKGYGNISSINAFHAADKCRRRITNLTHFVKNGQNCGISWPYLEPPWVIHWYKYKHTCYWFINSWISHKKIRNVRKQTLS